MNPADNTRHIPASRDIVSGPAQNIRPHPLPRKFHRNALFSMTPYQSVPDRNARRSGQKNQIRSSETGRNSNLQTSSFQYLKRFPPPPCHRLQNSNTMLQFYYCSFYFTDYNAYRKYKIMEQKYKSITEGKAFLCSKRKI